MAADLGRAGPTRHATPRVMRVSFHRIAPESGAGLVWSGGSGLSKPRLDLEPFGLGHKRSHVSGLSVNGRHV
jgi:hypothetical protein